MASPLPSGLPFEAVAVGHGRRHRGLRTRTGAFTLSNVLTARGPAGGTPPAGPSAEEGKEMRDLKQRLKQMVRRSNAGAHETRRRREAELSLIADQLLEEGFDRLKDPGDLGFRHVRALVERWKKEGLSPGTIKNRMAALRWWADQVGKRSIIPRRNDHPDLGIPKRSGRSNDEGRAAVLRQQDLERVPDRHVRMALRAADLFGVRRKEALHAVWRVADKGDRLELKKNWCKGGRGRVVPILTQEQRDFVNEAKALCRSTPQGSLIWTPTYGRMRNLYDNQTRRAGLAGHDYRHGYAQRRYWEITRHECPMAGGLTVADLDAEERALDRDARKAISEELGHGRRYITRVYLGW